MLISVHKLILFQYIVIQSDNIYIIMTIFDILGSENVEQWLVLLLSFRMIQILTPLGRALSLALPCLRNKCELVRRKYLESDRFPTPV